MMVNGNASDKIELKPRFGRMLGDFAIGAFAGVLVNTVFPEERDLEMILIGSLGVPIGTQFIVREGKYLSPSERVAGSIASYAGAVASSITYQLLRY